MYVPQHPNPQLEPGPLYYLWSAPRFWRKRTDSWLFRRQFWLERKHFQAYQNKDSRPRSETVKRVGCHGIYFSTNITRSQILFSHYRNPEGWKHSVLGLVVLLLTRCLSTFGTRRKERIFECRRVSTVKNHDSWWYQQSIRLPIQYAWHCWLYSN